VRIIIPLFVVVAVCLTATGGRTGARPSDHEGSALDARSAPPAPRLWLGSDTKVFTAAMIASLADAGRLSLDDRVGDLLPWYRQDTGQRMTVRHLLGHTSGLPDDALGMTDPRESGLVATRDIVLNRCSHDLQWEPGARWAYSDAGYVLLGAIVEEVTGTPYGHAMRDLVLTPTVAPNGVI